MANNPKLEPPRLENHDLAAENSIIAHHCDESIFQNVLQGMEERARNYFILKFDIALWSGGDVSDRRGVIGPRFEIILL